jgi:hypothetical protein
MYRRPSSAQHNIGKIVFSCLFLDPLHCCTMVGGVVGGDGGGGGGGAVCNLHLHLHLPFLRSRATVETDVPKPV